MSKKDLQKLVENAKYATEENTPCEIILGSMDRVDSVASMLDNHSDLIRLITTNEVLDYLEGDVSKDEITAFKAGAASIGAFMLECVMEREARNQKPDTDEG